jgi:hypothetical protein
MRSFCVAPDQIEACWEDFAPLFHKFEKGGADLSAYEAKERAKRAQIQVWGLQDDRAVHGVLATEVLRTARGLVCVITMAQGKAPDEPKRRLLDDILTWARAMGCVCVRVQGRRGWLRWDKRFRPTGIVAEIAL